MTHGLPVLVVFLATQTAAYVSPWPQPGLELAANHARDGAEKETASGDVRGIDTAEQTITLKHGRIESIAMPPMTMTFKMRDPALLNKVRVGDKVRFRAEVARNGTYYVIALEPVR